MLYHIPIVVGNIFLGAGPYAAVGVAGKLKGTSVLTFQNNAPNYGSVDRDVKFGNGNTDDFRLTDFGASFLAGIKFKGGLLVSTDYDLGLSNINTASTPIKSHNRIFAVSVGFAF